MLACILFLGEFWQYLEFNLSTDNIENGVEGEVTWSTNIVVKLTLE